MGSTTARPIDDPARVAPSIQSVVDMPVRRLHVPQATAPIQAIRTRLLRSAYAAIGTWRSSATRLTMPTSVRMPCRSSPKSSRISGRSTPNAVRSSSSTMFNPNSTING